MLTALLETREQQLSRAWGSAQLGADLQGCEVVEREEDLRSLSSHPCSKSQICARCWFSIQLLEAPLPLLVQGVLEAKLWEDAGNGLERLWRRLLEEHQAGVGAFQLFAASHSSYM